MAVFILTPSKPKQTFLGCIDVRLLQFTVLEPFKCKNADEKEMMEFQLMSKNTREKTHALFINTLLLNDAHWLSFKAPTE